MAGDSQFGEFGDEVPVADAVEQHRDAGGADEDDAR